MEGEIRKNKLLSTKFVINRSHGYSTNKKNVEEDIVPYFNKSIPHVGTKTFKNMEDLLTIYIWI